MRKRVSAMMARSVLAIVAAVALSGCVRHYRPPTAAEPHATIKVRRTFERSAGTHLDEVSRVSGRISERTRVDAQLAGAPRASAFLVHPRPAKLDVGAAFFHVEMRTVQEAYTVQVPYTTTESYNCGYGTQYQTCTRSVTHYRSETRYRWVTKPVEVSDGACSSAVALSPQNGHIYLLDFTYRDNAVCSTTCFEQTLILSDGTFQLAPCAALTEAEAKAMRDAED